MSKAIKLLIIAVVVVGVLFAAGMFTLAQLRSEKIEVGPQYEIGKVAVNLANERARFARLNIVLELAAEYEEEDLEELGVRDAEIRDMINNIIHSKTFEDLNRQGGLEDAKHLIKKSVNELLVKSEVNKVFFTEVALQ